MQCALHVYVKCVLCVPQVQYPTQNEKDTDTTQYRLYVWLHSDGMNKRQQTPKINKRSRSQTKVVIDQKSAVNHSTMNRIAAAGAAAGALAPKAVRRLSIDESSNSTPAVKDANKKNVGILAIEVYTPSTFISQEALEDHCGVSKGRYTIGLGQEGMGLCGDCEDVNSLALTVVQSLLEK